MADVMALGVGDIYKVDGCNELFVVIDNGIVCGGGMQTAVIRYAGGETSTLNFHDDPPNDRIPRSSASWGYDVSNNPMTKLAIGVDGKGTFTIKHINYKNRLVADNYKETEYYSRKMVKY